MATWLITGGNRGLGLAIARAALDAGHTVLVGARRPGSVPDDVADHNHAHELALDVADQGSVKDAVAAALREHSRIDVLVNNAGYSLEGAVEEISVAEARELFEVNVWGPMAATQAVLPGMREAHHGTVVNMSSLGGFVGGAGVGLYCASKFAVEALSEAMRAELAPFGVECMAVEPGAFRTDFLDGSSMRLADTVIDAYAGTPARAHRQWTQDNNHQQIGDPARAAGLIVDVVDHGDVPAHLPIGRDSLQVLATKVAALGEDADRWRERSAATAHDDFAR